MSRATNAHPDPTSWANCLDEDVDHQITAMSLANIYKSVRPSVVAFISKLVPVDDEAEEPPSFAPIIGTGFVIHEDGLLLTNSHVVNAFGKVPKPNDWPEDKWPVRGILFHLTEAGQIEIPLEIAGVIPVEGIDPGGAYYGPKTGPDLGEGKGVRMICLSPWAAQNDTSTAILRFEARHACIGKA